MSAVQWVSKCRGGREPRSGALMRLLGCLEAADGGLTRCMSLVWRTPSLTAFHVGSRRISTVTARSGPTLLVTDRYWSQRARYASECWRPAHPSVSCAVVSPSLYVRFLRSWAAFRGLIGEAEYFDAAVSDTDKIQELLEFVAWCASEGNQAGTIANKLSVVLHFHCINLQMELPTSSPLI